MKYLVLFKRGEEFDGYLDSFPGILAFQAEIV